MAWAVEEFLAQVLASLNEQGYRIDALKEPRPIGTEGGAWRVSLKSPDEGMPQSVVIKQADAERPWRWDDWICQYFLTDLAGTRGLGPEFFAGDERLGYYVLEDLGLGQDIGPVLLQEDSRSRLAAGLLSCALAGLHAGTWGREKPYNLLRARLTGESPNRVEELQEWREKAGAALVALGMAPEVCASALDKVQRELTDPGEFLALTHGDWKAQSVWYGDAGPRFLDFRHGAFRHALLDVAAWEARCWSNERTAESLWREYQEELARVGSDRAERFMEAYACARAFVGLGRLASGEHSATVQGLLKAASQEAGLEALAKIADRF